MSIFTKRRRTDWIVIHCAATPEGKEFNAADIDRMHRQQGWAAIGYHFIVRLDGTVETGRPQDVVGAHVKDYNSASIGISYVGGVEKDGKTPKDTRTVAQKHAIRKLLERLRDEYPLAVIQGHRDFPKVAKACPCFAAKDEYADI